MDNIIKEQLDQWIMAYRLGSSAISFGIDPEGTEARIRVMFGNTEALKQIFEAMLRDYPLQKVEVLVFKPSEVDAAKALGFKASDQKIPHELGYGLHSHSMIWEVS